MELRHLRYFVGVAEEQHYGRAAKRLFVAQPALSRQIQDLEKELGFPLFDRLPRGVRLNAAGKLFLEDSRRILHDVEGAKARSEQVAMGKSGTLRVAIATALSWHGLVANTFRSFRKLQPDVVFELHHMLSIQQIEPIISGQLDAGFSASVEPWNENLAHFQFTQDRMVLAVPKGHPLTRKKIVRLRDLQNVPFVWFPRWANPTFFDEMMRECARGGLTTPRIVQEAKDRDTNLDLVLCRVGLSWQPETVRWRLPRGITLVPVVDMNIRLPFHLIWKKDNSSPLLRNFVAQVQRELKAA